MKRSVSVLLVGLAAATAITAHGQGSFLFNNYAAPYVPIVYDTAVPGVGGDNVGAGEGVIIEVWWAPAADQPESALVFQAGIATFSRFAGYTYPWQPFTVGYDPGYFIYPITAQLRASGLAGGLAIDAERSRGPLVNANVGSLSYDNPALPPSNRTPGFRVFVPEPSTFTLAGLGVAALIVAGRSRLRGAVRRALLANHE